LQDAALKRFGVSINGFGQQGFCFLAFPKTLRAGAKGFLPFRDLIGTGKKGLVRGKDFLRAAS
jgi:hypothetical protein